MRTVSRLLLVAMMGGTLIGLFAAPSGAHFKSSSISLFVSDKTPDDGDKVKLFGTLRNRHNKCKANEPVHLIRKGDGVIETTDTDGDGDFVFKFKFDDGEDEGKYKARYEGRGKFGYQGKHRCGAAESTARRLR